MEIPVYRLPYTEEDITAVLAGVEKALRRGYLTDGGDFVHAFEARVAAFVGVRHAVAMNSATTALEATLRAASVDSGSVIVPSYTFIATPMSVANAGACPVYADIERETLALSVRTIEAAMRDDTRAVVLVHVGGIITPEIEAIRAFCASRQLFLLEDAACAIGSTYHGQHAGSFGHAAVFSFHHSKVLTTGEGGVLVTNDEELAERARRIRAVGLNRAVNNWQAFTRGSNFKLHELTAVLGIRHLEVAERIISERQRIARFFDEQIQFDERVMPLVVPSGVKSSYYKYLVRVQSPQLKTILRERLAERHIRLPPNLYDHLCHEQDVNREIGAGNAFARLPNSEYMRDHHLCLNMYNGLSQDEQQYIVDSVNAVLRSL